MKKSNNSTYVFASWAQSLQPTLMQKMLEASKNPNIISFALGLPDPNLFPVLEYQNSINQVLHSQTTSLQYAPPLTLLKQQIVKLMAARKVTCHESQIFLTTGAQQGISLLTRLLLNKGSSLLTDSLTYPGFLQIVTPYAPEIIGIPIHFDKGLCITSLETILKNSKNKPAFIYTVSAGHNPLGISLDEGQKQSLVNLCCLYQIPIIEDDPYGFLYFDSPTAPLRAYNDQWVFYVSTFSKIIAPSLRLGWLVVPEELIPRLSYIKEATDINTTTFTQHIIADFLNRNILEGHMRKLRQVYKKKRDIMIKTIKKFFPAEIRFCEPSHGFFIWIELPSQLNVMTLFSKALEENIAFMPGQAFISDPRQTTPNGIRLNFSSCDPLLIETGIKKLGKIIKNELFAKEILDINFIKVKP